MNGRPKVMQNKMLSVFQVMDLNEYEDLIRTKEDPREIASMRRALTLLKKDQQQTDEILQKIAKELRDRLNAVAAT